VRNGLFGVAASAGLRTIRNNAKNTMFMLKQVVNVQRIATVNDIGNVGDCMG